MRKTRVWILVLLLSVILSACGESREFISEPSSVPSVNNTDTQQQTTLPSSEDIFSVENVEPYTEQPYMVINDDLPYFSEEDLTTQPFELYSELDELGRCGVAYANICMEIMPTEERGEIGQIKPSGWHTVKYNDIIEGNYLYNRCHLIGFQLAGENANEKNLITGTRYMNVDGMLPFENMVTDYVKETENHVLYRVTPIFEGENLLASGVLMEAESVEDKGDGILFCVYVYNVQPGITIDYLTGESCLDENIQPTEEETGQTELNPDSQIQIEAQPEKEMPETPETSLTPEPEPQEITEPEPQGTDYILNTNTKKFHYPYCSSVDQMKEKNKQSYTGNRNDIIAQGYDPCKRCNP